MKSNPTMNFYHANSKGTGSAVTIALHPAQTLADKVEILAKIKKDVRKILDGTEN